MPFILSHLKLVHFWNANTSLNNAHQYYCNMSTGSKIQGELKN